MVDSRSARQQEGIAKWLETSCSSTFEWATGMGKSFTAVTIIRKMQVKYPEALCHIVVPTLFLQEQFHKAIAAASLSQVSVFVINTYVRQPRACDLLIADEVHLFLGEHALQFPKLFTAACQHRWFLGLSATLTTEEKDRLSELGAPVVDTITLQQAQEADWVATCKTYNLGVELSFAEETEYKKWNDIFNSNFARFNHDFQTAMLCVASPSVRLNLATQMGWQPGLGKEHRWSPTSLGSAANQWLVASKNRQRIVNTCDAKYRAALFLCRENNVKTICFSESTEFASRLAAFMPDIARAYHSNLESQQREYTTVKTYKTKPDVVTVKTKSVGPATLRQEAISAFLQTDGPVRVLSTAKALDQGADFANLQLGIETSGNGSVRQKVQRTGRVVRQNADASPKLSAYVHIYAKSTYEQNKLARKQKGILGIQWIDNPHDIVI